MQTCPRWGSQPLFFSPENCLRKTIYPPVFQPFFSFFSSPEISEFAVSAVKITSLKVPSTYLLDKSSKNPDPLILDCEYEVDESEKGFVLKWFLDGQPVYQWIPSKNPFPFVSSPWNSRPFFGKYKHTHGSN